MDDRGVHAACCGTNTWTATKGSSTVFINNKAAHRLGDQNRHCGGMGQLIEGSPNVIVGESGGGGGGSGGGGASSSSSSGAGGSGPAGSSGRGDGNPDRDTARGSDSGSGNRRGDREPSGDHAGTESDSDALSFLELSLVDRNNQPLGGLRYRVKAPDGAIREGALDGDGKVRIDGIKQGTCEVSFPDPAADIQRQA